MDISRSFFSGITLWWSKANKYAFFNFAGSTKTLEKILTKKNNHDFITALQRTKIKHFIFQTKFT